MSKPKRLKVVADKDQKLGRPTIMDRALAQRHGSAYVLLSAFAIDVDRVRELDPDDGSLAFAWEVALTDAYITRLFAPQHKGRVVAVLEDIALYILELPRPTEREPAPLGTQLSFAIFSALHRGELPEALESCFRVWKKPPVDVAEDVRKLLTAPDEMRKAISFCLSSQVDPPLIEPVRAALNELAEDFA